jgi:two-component system, OmpR family, phosphate regulon sensor histidine kinase PhoR
MKRLWPSSLVTKIFLSYFAIVLLLFAGFYLYSSTLLRGQQVALLKDRMEQEAHLLSHVLPFDAEGPPLDTLCRELARELGSRITIITLDGRVLGDSAENSATMESHAGRPEVVEALNQGSGSAIRYSTTVRYDLLYRAFRQSGDGHERIVRVATPLKDVEAFIRSFRRSLLVGLLLASAAGLLLAGIFSRFLTRRIQRLVRLAGEVARGNFSQNAYPKRSGDEIDLLEIRLSEMSLKLRDHVRQIVGEKEKVDSILRCMIEGVLVLDSKGRVLVVNDQARTMLKARQGRDLHGVSLLEVSRHPEMHGILREILSFDFSGSRYSKEIELEDNCWFRVNAVSLRDVQERPLGSILVFHDITDIKRLESMRSDFVANVSHELRTPLTAIRGYVETLLHAPPSDAADSRQFLEIIDRHSERLSRLTEDLLTLSDLESGNIRLALRPLDVGEVIQRVSEVFWDQAAKRNIQLTQRIDAGLAKVSGDLDRLQQLFINLVDNAIKYTPPGGQVSLSAGRCAASNGAEHIEIAVSDSGPGIAEKDLPRLTERFYRVDRARSRDLGGTGLGLAIVKHIVQAHGGELIIESAINQGTTVRVRLPVALANGNPPKSILFLCTANSCRSQMAEGFARHIAGARYQILSAGIEAHGIHPLAVRVMNEVGIDITRQTSKTLVSISLDSVDQVVTLCGDAEERCPAFLATVKQSHWSLPDPALAHGDEEEVLEVFRQVRDEIHRRVQALLA